MNRQPPLCKCNNIGLNETNIINDLPIATTFVCCKYNTYVFANKAFCALCDRKLETIVGRNIALLTPRSGRKRATKENMVLNSRGWFYNQKSHIMVKNYCIRQVVSHIRIFGGICPYKLTMYIPQTAMMIIPHRAVSRVHLL